MEIRIYYEDTDCAGVVYYANYLRFFERSRTDYMETRGINLAELTRQGIFFMVASARIDYRSPARYGDTLVVETTLPEISHASFTFHYKIHEKLSQRLIVEGETKIVTVDQAKKPKRLTPELVTRLKK
jgi:acyl-CoA thioester hydrolase